MSTVAERPSQKTRPVSRMFAAPLARVSRGIRAYVILEGAILLVCAAALWFWVVFAIDWGLFKVFHLDYIRDGGGVVRGLFRGFFLGLLGLGVLYVLGYRVLYRLFVAFRPAALALVIERKYARVLGDRLVTAVELADPAKAEEFGYSWVMVEQTVEDAEKRLGEVSVAGVFNWGRLWLQLAGAACLAATVAAFGYFFYHLTHRFVHRNLYMAEKHWDRNTMLVVLEFQDTDRRAVPYRGSFRVHVQALVNVVATDTTPVGWRPAEWPDLLPRLMDPSQPDRQLFPRYHGDVAAWELKDLDFTVTLHRALPDSWRTWPLDEVESKHGHIHFLLSLERQRGAEQTQRDQDLQAMLSELGRAVIDSLLGQLAEVQAGKRARLDPELRELLPDDWKDAPPARLSSLLLASRRLTQAEITRMRHALLIGQPLPSDAAQALNFLFSPLKPPLLGMIDLQNMAWRPSYAPDFASLAEAAQPFVLFPELPPLALTLGRDRLLHALTTKHVPPPEMTLTDSDRHLLLDEWKGLNVQELHDQLLAFERDKGVMKFGENMNARLGQLFKQLGERAEQPHWGALYTYRRLAPPSKLDLTHHQVLTEEEAARARAQTHQTTLNREPERFIYRHELRSIERETRLRISGGDAVTPWYTIEVKPAPFLQSLRYRRTELGYLHASNERVLIHNREGQRDEYLIPTEERESRISVKSGTLLTLGCRCSKELEHVEVVPQDRNELHLHTKLTGALLSVAGHDAIGSGLAGALQGAASGILSNFVETQNPALESLSFAPQKDPYTFEFALKEAVSEDVRLLLRFRDTDGITGTYSIVIMVASDQEPRFEFVTSEVVRREAVTNKVIIPFSVKVSDDVGLLGMWYEVSILRQSDRKVLRTQTVPLRTFFPLDSYPDLSRVQRVPLRLAEVGAGFAHQTIGQGQLLPAFALAQAPLAGPFAAWQPTQFDVTRSFQREYQVRQGPLPPIRPSDEYLDTMLLDLSPIESKGADGKPVREEIEPPYILSIRLVARDNRVRTDPATGLPIPANNVLKTIEPFEFLVLTEPEVISEEGRREYEIRERCEGLLERLKASRNTLDKLHAEFGKGGDDDVRRAKSHVQDAQATLNDARDVIEKNVIRDMRQIYREFWLNRIREDLIHRIDVKICRPLEALVASQGPFDAALAVVGNLAGELDRNGLKTPPSQFKLAAEEMTQLIKRFEDIVSEIKELESLQRVIGRFKDLIRAQRVILDMLNKKRKDIIAHELKP